MIPPPYFLTSGVGLECPGSPVPLNSTLYIDRPPIEELAYQAINQPGSLLRIEAARKMGKNSLLLRILNRAVESGYQTVSLDFQQADRSGFTNLDTFLRWFCANVTRQLGVNPRLDCYWDETIGSKMSCTFYFQEYVLAQIESPLVLVLNEVNQVFEHPAIAQEFLLMLRSWNENTSQKEQWQKLRLVVARGTESYLPLKVHQSPFNVGLQLQLPEFNLQQVQDLAQRHGLNWTDETEARQLVDMVGGHPQRVRLALYWLGRQETTLALLLQQAPTLSGIYSDHLRSLQLQFQSDRNLEIAFRQVINAPTGVQLNAAIAYQLESVNLITLKDNLAKPSCKLYRLYFGSHWLSDEIVMARSSLSTGPLEDCSVLSEGNSSLESEDLEISNRNHFAESKKERLEKESKEQLKRLCEGDAIAQLANRHRFDRALEQSWQQLAREVAPLSLILCKLDFSSHSNDTDNQEASNRCLQQVMPAMHQSISSRTDDLVARYGNEKLAVLLPYTYASSAVQIAEAIRVRVKALAIAAATAQINTEREDNREKANVGGSSTAAAQSVPATVTVSLGVASTIPDSKTSPTKLVAAAEQALSQSNVEGCDRITFKSLESGESTSPELDQHQSLGG